jgi:hypothetical protein
MMGTLVYFAFIKLKYVLPLVFSYPLFPCCLYVG